MVFLYFSIITVNAFWVGFFFFSFVNISKQNNQERNSVQSIFELLHTSLFVCLYIMESESYMWPEQSFLSTFVFPMRPQKHRLVVCIEDTANGGGHQCESPASLACWPMCHPPCDKIVAALFPHYVNITQSCFCFLPTEWEKRRMYVLL